MAEQENRTRGRRKLPYIQFYPNDWLYDTRILTCEEKAAWIDMLCFMWNSPTRGQVTGQPNDLARMLGIDWQKFGVIFDSLKRKNVCEVTEGNGEVTVKSRRMIREENKRESGKIRKRRHDERASNAKVTGEKSEVICHITTSPLPPKGAKTLFRKPTAEEVTAYAKSIAFDLDGQSFVDAYEAKGWLIGRSPMRDWQAAVRTWRRSRAGAVEPKRELVL